MNARRAANRSRSMKDHNMRYSSGETHESMRGRKIPHRVPEHHEEGGNYGHEAHASFGSSASMGASKGPGPLPGAGELMAPGAGPGPASRKYAQVAAAETPESQAASRDTPRGMKVYNQE